MTALFSRWSDTKLRLRLGCLVVVLAGVPLLLTLWVRSPMQNLVGEEREQPVEFDHRHHTRDDGIDCMYCHYLAADTATAGMPETAVCMGCHTQIWPDSPLLEPVQHSWTSGQPIPWRRIHNLPEFTYFNHSIHIRKGIGCESCHGRVDLMANVHKEAPLTMAWCLDCHRNPDPHLRPPEMATVMGYRPEGPQPEIAARLKDTLNVRPRTDCTTCHR